MKLKPGGSDSGTLCINNCFKNDISTNEYNFSEKNVKEHKSSIYFRLRVKKRIYRF